MPDVIVHFNSRRDQTGRPLRAIAGPGVKTVVIGDLNAAREVAKKEKVQVQPGGRTFPPEVTVETQDGEVLEMLDEGEEGPEEVCYLVPGRMICWE